MSGINVFLGQGFIGANLTWNTSFSIGDDVYWDVCFIPNDANESLTINSKTFMRPADGSLQLVVNYTNNTSNDTYFHFGLIRNQVW